MMSQRGCLMFQNKVNVNESSEILLTPSTRHTKGACERKEWCVERLAEVDCEKKEKRDKGKNMKQD
jgi:hypothetical protein